MPSTPSPVLHHSTFRIPTSRRGAGPMPLWAGGRIQISVTGSVGVKKTQSNLVIQRFVSTTGKNQYLLTSAGELFLKMPQCVASARHAFVLNAWDSKQSLAAFYVIDLAARDFANYIIGCYSKNYHVLGASDLLLFELIKLSAEYGKGYIHLGLGVNRGIRRFKEKWGGKTLTPL